MKNRFKVLVFILLVLGQVVLHRYVHQPSPISLDLLYLILVYVSIMSTFYKTIASACAVGLVLDYFSGNIMGVFGFSRTISAFLLHEISRRIDLKNNIFVFLMISVSLLLSNVIANVFLYFILGFSFNIGLVVYQPLLTGALGIAIAGSTRAKVYLDVY
ncbi:MAG: rod shape-determining protein MreD [Candidatus Omnitrophota bacterium]